MWNSSGWAIGFVSTRVGRCRSPLVLHNVRALLNEEAASLTCLKALLLRLPLQFCRSSLMVPGEGMLVGNFARALFLVHSECAESSYIASRPFRVNAGAVHAYVKVESPDNRGQSCLNSCHGAAPASLLARLEHARANNGPCSVSVDAVRLRQDSVPERA